MSKAPTLELHENGRYYIHWIEGRRTRRVSTGEREMAKAQRFFGQWLLNEKHAAQHPETSVVDFKTVWDQYITDHMSKCVSGKSVAGWGKYLIAGFGDLAVADIGQAHLDKYVRDRSAGRIGTPAKLSTIWNEVGKLKAAINFAIKRKKLPASARPELDNIAPPEARERWLRVEEVNKILAKAAERRRGNRLSRVERFLHIAIETAARRAVIERLQWDQVDLEAGVIHYHRYGDLRSKKKRPSVPISNALRPVLERAYKERISDYVLDHPGEIYKPVLGVAKAAGVKGVYPHIFRHTSATWMARRGVPLWKIAGILGNSVQVVERVYAKHSPDGLADAVEAISIGRAAVAA
ncbi:tyrosine-type recombinase/integrase [Methylobacterium brachiatum]|uniref:tyrosine-type recombinase/integrase n=1 Tax=Methylobacterium brachiatum TaxID=269660 RepID=UPI0008F20CCC|nr:site-specific integrase [Methylobacterium brachiatum]SFI05048.1 Site-specific recombinase XerD [Methylobacterium brachiatum]